MPLINALRWRYATKKMDPSQPVATEQVDRLLEAIRLTASSIGLQPYHVLIVTNQEVKEKIKAIAYNQSQVSDCSHLLVFAAWDDYTVERINMMFDLTNDVRGFKDEGWEAYREVLLKSYPNRGSDINFAHASKQAYIGLGTALVMAAMQGVDSTPMEGFDADALDRILGLREQGLRSVVLLPLGHRKTDEDWLAKLAKVRRPMDKFVIHVS